MEIWMIFNWVLAGHYLALLAFCSFQLIRIVYYRHNTASYQSYFLVLCVLWTVSRITLFTLVGVGSPGSFLDMSGWFIHIVFWFPINLQFATFSLLVLFFAQIVHKFNFNPHDKKKFVIAWASINLIFLIISFTGLLLSPPTAVPSEKYIMYPQASSVLIFFILILILSYYGWKLDCLLRKSRVTLQVRISSPRHIIILTSVIVFLFSTRCFYDAYSSFTHKTISVVGGDLRENLIKFLAYFSWEITPLLAVMIFFRNIPKTRSISISRRPLPTSSSDPPYGSINDSSRSRPGLPTRSLFENPNRYDMHDDDAFSSYGSPYAAYTVGSGTPTYQFPQSSPLFVEKPLLTPCPDSSGDFPVESSTHCDQHSTSFDSTAPPL
eukprot:Sdes_comp22484_c0_seq1m20932